MSIHHTALAEMTRAVRNVNTANGWHGVDRTLGEGLALLHSEVSEALDAYRKHGLADVGKHHADCQSHSRAFVKPCNCGDRFKPESYGSELADVLIRLLDQADRDGVDLAAEFDRKLAHNATRGYRHGGRKL